MSDMGLKDLPFVNIVLFLLNILIIITFGGESMNGRLRCLGFWLRVVEDVGIFCRGNRSYFHSENLTKQIAP